MAHVLDGYVYPLDPRPGGFTGVRLAPRRADVATFGDNVSLYWDAVWPDTLVREEWTQLEAAQYLAFHAKWLANGGGTLYDWSPGDGQTYRVEIVALDGRAHKAETYVNVSLVLKVHGVAG
ncbi:MAG TPA: hypothetical protein PLZ36_01925 [Armatimonadota bacterium]|nr:hypothetical protein [Armatimonadota bacterium]HOS44675.1 hypothetical protein [Armatimonadota bacterium]